MRDRSNIYYHVEDVEYGDRLRNREPLTKEHLLDNYPLFLSRSDSDWWPEHLPYADRNFRLYEIELEDIKPKVFTAAKRRFKNRYYKHFEWLKAGLRPKGGNFFELTSTEDELGECFLLDSSKYVKSIKLIKGPKPKSLEEELEAKVALANLLESTNGELEEPYEQIQEAYTRHPTGDLSEEDVLVMYSNPEDCSGTGKLIKVSFRIVGQVKYTNPEETNQEFLDKALITDEPELKQNDWCSELYNKYHLNLLTKGSYKEGVLYVLLDPQVSIIYIEEISE